MFILCHTAEIRETNKLKKSLPSSKSEGHCYKWRRKKGIKENGITNNQDLFRQTFNPWHSPQTAACTPASLTRGAENTDQLGWTSWREIIAIMVSNLTMVTINIIIIITIMSILITVVELPGEGSLSLSASWEELWSSSSPWSLSPSSSLSPYSSPSWVHWSAWLNFL